MGYLCVVGVVDFFVALTTRQQTFEGSSKFH